MDPLAGHQADASHCHLRSSTNRGGSPCCCAEGPSPSLQTLCEDLSLPHSSAVAPHRHLRPFSWQCHGPSVRGRDTSLPSRWGRETPHRPRLPRSALSAPSVPLHPNPRPLPGARSSLSASSQAVPRRPRTLPLPPQRAQPRRPPPPLCAATAPAPLARPASAALTAAAAGGPARRGAGRRRPRRRRFCRGSAGRSAAPGS